MLRFHLSIFAIIRLFLLFCLFLLSFVLLSFSFVSTIIYISELGLFLLSLVDNNYADKTLVYKVTSYT